MRKYRTTDPERLDPVHPGDVLLEDFIKPMGLTLTMVSAGTGIPVSRLSLIIKGGRTVTADTALRLGRYFGMTPSIWTGIQMKYDLEVQELILGDRLDREVHPLQLVG